jgi:hypothetical protein
MKKMVGIVSVWLCMLGLAWGGTLGDVNGDGAVGLPEAIHALQVSSGIRPQGVTPRYDMAEYALILGTFEGQQKNYGSLIQNQYATQGFASVTQETVNGKEFFVYNGTDYYQINSQGIFYSGYKSGSETRWFTTPVIVGSRSMSPGDVFTNFYEDPPGSGTLNYREYTFLGIEDVTVPAGAFPGCLKIVLKQQTPIYARTTMSYYAHGVGRIKQDRLHTPYSGSWSGYTNELVSAKIGTNVIPANVVYHAGGGVWNRTAGGLPSGSGSFTWRFSLPNLPAWGTVTLVGINPSPSPDMTLPLVSQDGIHFSASWYPIPAIINFNLTVDQGMITGTYTPAEGTEVTLTGTYSVAP